MTINCKGQLIDLTSPKIMGILNVTPDSFYDGNKHKNECDVLKHVENMLTEGATFIDVGGYSSRPNAPEISETEEIARVLPNIELILEYFPDTLISIDTFRSEVANRAIDAGACLINDISAGILDGKMLLTVAKLKVPYIMMHMKGTPQTMQQLSTYDDLLQEMIYFFSERLVATRALGIIDVIIDPGFGFAKTIEQNFNLLQHLEVLQIVEKPILVGLSRKSMIYKTLNSTAKEALNGTTALHILALTKGASILRVHDVKEAMECTKLLKAFK